MRHLKILPTNSSVKELYENHSYNLEGDVGFDLIFPEDVKVYYKQSNLINLQVKIASYIYDSKSDKYCEVGFPIVPRSSINKLPYRMSNSTGVVDRYRGEIFVSLDYLDLLTNSQPEQKLDIETGKIFSIITKGTRLFQIIDPLMDYITWELVKELPSSGRGDRGNGSTGK